MTIKKTKSQEIQRKSLQLRSTIIFVSIFYILSCSTTQNTQSNNIHHTSEFKVNTIPIEKYNTSTPTFDNNSLQKYNRQTNNNENQITTNNSINNNYVQPITQDFDFSTLQNRRFINWINSDTTGYRKSDISEYYNFLVNNTGYAPNMEEMLRSARSWLKCGYEPYGIPPRNTWGNMIDTLQLIKQLEYSGYLPHDYQLVSVYRDPALNRCAKGSKGSKHMVNAAVDIKIQYTNTLHRNTIASNLCGFWSSQGENHNMGLGLYKSGTVHIDTQGHRTWGSSYSRRSSKCLKK